MNANNNTNSSAAACPRCRTHHEPSDACSPGTLVTQAESLFESYLAARLLRARRNLSAAKVTLLRDPCNDAKREALLKAEAEARKLDVQLLEQARRVSAAREDARNQRVAAASPAHASSAQATEDFRVLQAAKAGMSLSTNARSSRQAQPDKRDCPRCGSHVSHETKACRCGYTFFPRKDIVAEPFLSEEELAVLRAAKFTE